MFVMLIVLTFFYDIFSTLNKNKNTIINQIFHIKNYCNFWQRQQIKKNPQKKITNISKFKDDLRKFDENEILVHDQMKFYELCFNFKGDHAHWSYIHHCKIISEFSAQANILFYKFYNNTTVINFYFRTQQFPNLKVKTCHRNFFTVKKLSFLACCRDLFRGNFCVFVFPKLEMPTLEDSTVYYDS